MTNSSPNTQRTSRNKRTVIHATHLVQFCKQTEGFHQESGKGENGGHSFSMHTNYQTQTAPSHMIQDGKSFPQRPNKRTFLSLGFMADDRGQTYGEACLQILADSKANQYSLYLNASDQPHSRRSFRTQRHLPTKRKHEKLLPKYLIRHKH